MFYIYLIHNIINNKVYVGKTSDPSKRWRKHLRIASGKRQKEKFYIHRAISKYGADNFVFSIVQQLHTEQEGDLAEAYWIEYFQSKNNEYGYNLTKGGEGASGRVTSEATKQKQREKATGRKHTDETIQSMSGDNNHISKLTADKIQEIRYKYNTLKYNLVSLSKEYGVSARTISRAVYNIDWYDGDYVPPIARKINHRGTPKLDKEKANKIRQMRNDGISVLELSKLFNVTKQNILMIINGKTWRNNE